MLEVALMLDAFWAREKCVPPLWSVKFGSKKKKLLRGQAVVKRHYAIVKRNVSWI